MKNVELLSPAGSMESAIAAIQSGCDAIYMAGSRFGARAYATNFDELKMKEAIAYAHAYGVKIYITINTLIHDEELESCFSYIKFLYESKVDALIIQDLGILSYVRNTYPDFEVHASTQMHVNNKASLEFLKSLGVQRAVLAREVTIQEIKEYAKVGIELEVFVHGALCVAYSGQCLFSSMVGDRSGNRGQCAQGCRMPYTLIDDTKKEYAQGYLLSLKDLNTLDKMQDIVDSNVASLKLEGRMKKSEYVASITSLYRGALDYALTHTPFHVDKEALKQNKVLFNRGYTHGFMYGNMGSLLSNPLRPNHMGIEVGKVVKIKHDKIVIQLIDDLNQHDGIRFLMDHKDVGCKVNRMYVNGLLSNKASKNTMIELDNTLEVKVGCKVLKTSDYYLEKQIQSQIELTPRKVDVSMHFSAYVNTPMYLLVEDGKHQVEVYGKEPSVALKLASNEEMIHKQLAKTNETIFKLATFTCELDQQLFIVNKQLNEMRREALQQLFVLREEDSNRIQIPYQREDMSVVSELPSLLCCVQTQEQVDACLALDVPAIYVLDRHLYNTYKHTNRVHLRSSKVETGSYTEVSMIQELGGLHSPKGMICDSGIHVYNAHSALFLQHLGVQAITLSLELKEDKIEALMKHYHELSTQPINVIQVVYGRVEVMVSKHCPINASILDNNKKNCKLCRNKQYYLKDKFNNEYPMLNDTLCNMHLYDYNTRNDISKIPHFKQLGITHFRLDFTTETSEQLKRTIIDAKRTLSL